MKNSILIEKTILFAICIYLPVASLAQAGSLDLSLGDSGIITTNIIRISKNSGGNATAIQSDGKILLAGYHEGTKCDPNSGNSSDDDILLVRYNTNGSLDATFGNDGIVSTDLGSNDAANAIGIQSDGKIVVAGTSGILVRYNTNGSLDTTFGTSGIVTGRGRPSRSIAIQSDDKIMVVFERHEERPPPLPPIITNELVRFTINGSLDTTFGESGIVTTNTTFGGIADEEGGYIAIQSDGKIVVAGTDNLRRYTNTGTLDTTFGNGGMATTAKNIYATCIAIQKDGKITVGGVSQNSSKNNYALVRYNTNGSLDSTFGKSGIVTTSIGISSVVYSIAIQSNGKIVMGGYSFSYKDTIQVFALARYTSNGSLDYTFGNGGIVTLAISSTYSIVQSVAIQSDGKIIAVGTISPNAINLDRYFNNNGKMCLVRFTTNGSLDNSVGIVTTTNAGKKTCLDDRGNATAIQSDGKIVVAGRSDQKYALIRYNTNGSLDATFGIGGIVATDIWYSINSIAIQSDGKILVAGQGSQGLIRFNSNGSFDATFGNGGTAIISGDAVANAVTIQNDGKIIVACESQGGTYISLLRFTANGTLDSSFGFNGIATKSGLGGRALAIQSDGKIAVAGFSKNSSPYGYDFALVRYNTNGSLDSTFGTGGIVSTAIGDFAIAEAIAIQSDGKILLAGWTNTADGGFVLARYNTNGSLDNTFGNNGIVNTNISDVEKVNSLVIQSDGKIIAGGYSISGSDFALNLSVVRYKTNGSLDSTFGNAGIVATPVGNHNTDLYSIKCALALQTDGKIIIAGVSAFNNNYDFALVRYHNDNTLGINEIGNKNTEINIFPNPTTGNIYLSVNANIVLTDLLGKLLLEQKNTKHLDISALPAGMYFLRYGDNLKQTFKVIKE